MNIADYRSTQKTFAACNRADAVSRNEEAAAKHLEGIAEAAQRRASEGPRHKALREICDAQYDAWLRNEIDSYSNTPEREQLLLCDWTE